MFWSGGMVTLWRGATNGGPSSTPTRMGGPPGELPSNTPTRMVLGRPPPPVEGHPIRVGFTTTPIGGVPPTPPGWGETDTHRRGRAWPEKTPLSGVLVSTTPNVGETWLDARIANAVPNGRGVWTHL
jgi:hypothetical protein